MPEPFILNPVKHMPSLDDLLSKLEVEKTKFGADGKQTEKLLAVIDRRRFSDAESLIRFHEALLFIRAFPQSANTFRSADDLLSRFEERVERVQLSGADPTAFDYIESSGIAGTTVSGTFSYAIARWLADRHWQKIDVDWNRHEKKERLGSTLPRLLPLLEEDSLVEANIPYLAWLRAAKAGRKEGDLVWLVRRFEQLRLSEKEKAELYDSLELPVAWRLNKSRASRTRNIRKPRSIFYHKDPLIRRSDVSLAEQLNSPPVKLEKLSRAQGEETLDAVRAATTVRYRELYGITHGDAGSVVRANVGRGVVIYLWGLPPDRRLPLRAYHAGFTLKNGVPINYIEGISLFERMELGFNTFYTFREGETAWVYAKVLRLLHQRVGATCFSLDPYQIGFNNEEAIESGAFWFYRKLGFRPTRAELIKLVEAEEKKIRANRQYRTDEIILKRFSTRHMIYEMPGTSIGDWDRFQVRNLGLEVQRRMAEKFDGDSEKIREASANEVARSIGIGRNDFNEMEREAFDKLALVLALIRGLGRWTDEEKNQIAQILRAKAGVDESLYARLLQRHRRLRDAVIKLGSRRAELD